MSHDDHWHGSHASHAPKASSNGGGGGKVGVPHGIVVPTLVTGIALAVFWIIGFF